ncbi:MAG: MG2 domain-containing protein [Bacteroides sp.]|nr:MG2 domain-containing protein [Bacteroides sp.]MCM1379925.1 MG2 domain-containing protein [Bacteroides sp.]MCM1446220.1 MG2 domain-containing protein [Prevotella sp.]
MKLLSVFAMSLIALTGFGTQLSKPDFAYPKIVSKNADMELKSAIKNKNPQAAVRALLDYGLAQAAINPDKLETTMQYFSEVSEKVDSPTGKAMILLAQASAQQEDSLVSKAILQYGNDLKAAQSADWKTVINADELFFPTLYDFAVAQSESDSIIDAAIDYDANRPYPLAYLQLRKARNFEDYKNIYIEHRNSPVAKYLILAMAKQAYTFNERKEAYELIKNNQGKETREAIEALTWPSINISCNSVVAKNDVMKINVQAICLNTAKLEIKMQRPIAKTVKTIDLNFNGSGVFQIDTVVDLILEEYGTYRIYPTYDGLNKKNQDYTEITVTDFLMAKPIYGNKKFDTMALDVKNGSLQTDVKFITNDLHVITAQRGNDKYSPSIYSYGGYEPNTNSRKNANILTDRAIYHPGDKLRFVATLMEAKGMKLKLLGGTSAKVILKNVNWQNVAELTLTSDDFGRISGEFALPKDGLTGRYIITVEEYDNAYVLVTDYKAPTFVVETNAEHIDSTTVRIYGQAVGYNGFPISNANVNISVNELPKWIWFRNFRNAVDDEVATDTTTTDSNGYFSVQITVPNEVNLSATAVVTSQAGESREESTFIPFNRYYIEGNIGEYVEVGNAPKFRVLDSNGNPTDIKPIFTLNDSIVPDESWNNVPSGEYKVKVTANDAADVEYDVIVYRRDDAMPPTKSALFVPVVTANPGDKLLVGTSFADSHILMTVWTPDSIIEQRWLTPQQGNFFIDVEIPKKVNNAQMSLMTLRNYRYESVSVKISRPDVARKLEIEIESLRDNMTPGEKDVWIIKVKDITGTAANSALIADVYCKALDTLQPFTWRFNTPYIYGKSFNIEEASSHETLASNSTRANLYDPFSSIHSSFNLWDQTWPSFRLYDYGTMSRMLMSKNMATGAVYDMVEESAVDMETADASTTVEDDTEQNAADQYRLPEVAVALWKPTLTTNSDGTLQLQFVAPNANTTWAVNLLAYDKDMLYGSKITEIVTSKPVMVQPQLPRFLRVGDKIMLQSVVMNNTDSAALVESMIELFDPASGTVFAHKDFSTELDAMGSDVISLDFTAPDVSMFGIRVRAKAGNFTDGEQSIIAILPNRVDVRTGKPIFLPSDSTDTELEIPRGGVLTFTPNAVWQCVSALPGLIASNNQSALDAVSALFSAATARGLLRQHPEIGRALHSWENEDSVLISQLLKNEDLKTALLQSTPFVDAAQSETDQRARLLLLFNNKEIDKTIKSAIATLTKLTRNGGLAWTQNCNEPSMWITQSVLSIIAQLRSLGYCPESKDLEKVVNGCVTYLDKEVARIYAKDKNARFTEYLMLRSKFPEVRQSAPAKRAADASVQYLVGHWRDLSLQGIAQAAIILYDNNYPTTSHKLIESLRQHEAWAQLPLSPTLLNAFAKVEPGCPEVEYIRNEYVSRKQSMDWGSGLEVSNLVASILNSGANWLVPAANELSVKVNGQDFEPRVEKFSGEFRLNLPEGGKVNIIKSKFPAWGGIFSASVDSIQKVEAFSSEQLKLTRQINGKMKVGEKVEIILTLDASQDLDYVLVKQPHCAGMEVVDQIPSTLWLGWLTAYREPTATCTNWYFNRLVKGKTTISETFYVTEQGEFILAPAEVQSQYAPEFQSHTAGNECCTNQN